MSTTSAARTISKRRIVRAIGDPRLRLREDKLRMLRAVRFAATFDFEIEPATLQAIQEMAAEITTRQRRAHRHGNPPHAGRRQPRRRALRLLRETGLLGHVLPEVARLSPRNSSDTIRVLDALREPSLSLALAALLIDVPESESCGVRSTEY